MDNTRDVVEATAIDFAQKIHRRLSVIERFTGKAYPGARQDILDQAIKMVRRLAERGDGEGPQDTEDAARIVCEVLFGAGNHPPAEFWATPLGAGVAWSIGYPLPGEVPTWAAAAVLRCSRQLVWRMTWHNRDKPFTAQGLRDEVRSSPRWRDLTTATVVAEG